MRSKQGKTKKKKELKIEDILKYEIANELGLGEKLSSVGWGGLTAEETGRIGGIVTRRKKALLEQINNLNKQLNIEKKA